jgi:hypothetical protein
VSRTGVQLNGQALGAGLPTALGEPMEPLFRGLKSARELWRKLHPGQDFSPTATVVVAKEVTLVAGAAVVRTAALAGYPEFEVQADSVRVGFRYLPSAPDPSQRERDSESPAPQSHLGRELPTVEPPQPKAEPEALRLNLKGEGTVNAHFEGPTTPRLGLRRTLPGSELGPFVARECAITPGTCIDRVLLEVGDGSFFDAVQLLQAVTTQAFTSRRASVAFESPKADRPAAPVEAASAGKSRVIVGAVTAVGPLSEAVILSAVQPNAPRFLVCYREALAQNPELEGRVVLRFVIGRDGMTWNVTDAGSDLPDSRMTRCVVRACGELRFPEPDGNIVKVVLPLMFITK